MDKTAYIAGLVASDGHLRKDDRNKEIEIATSNREFSEMIKNILSKVSKNKVYSRKNKTAYVVCVADKNLHQLLNEKFRIPVGKKSDILVPPEISEREEIKFFLRGFFDGDSTIHTRKMRNKKVPRIRVMSTSSEILIWIKEQLENFGINSGSLFEDKPHGFGKKICYRLEIYGSAVKKFYENINYFHPEKSKKIKKLIFLLE